MFMLVLTKKQRICENGERTGAPRPWGRREPAVGKKNPRALAGMEENEAPVRDTERRNAPMEKIASFRGEYRFLSNFYPAPFTFDGISYRNVEAAFRP